MRKILVRTLLILGLSFAGLYADECKTWAWNDFPITMKTCANEVGKSGYLVKKNDSSKDVKLCWEITYENGKKKKRCQSRLRGNQESRSSDYNIGQMDVIKLRITKFEYLGGNKKTNNSAKNIKKVTSIYGKWELLSKQANGSWSKEFIVLKKKGKATYIASNGESYLAKWVQHGKSIKVPVFGTRTHYNRNDPALTIRMNINNSKFTGESIIHSSGVRIEAKGRKY